MPNLFACGLDRLTLTQDSAFDWHARRFGHDLGRLRGGVEVVSYPSMPSLAALRGLSAATPEQRRRRQEVYFSPPIAIRRSIGQGVHDRLEAAVFADGQVDPADEARAARHFPFPTRILSVRHRDVAEECWDLSVRGEHWGLDDRDDIFNVVNIGSLYLAPGAIVTVRGNLLILIVQRLICGGDSAAACQLAILPTPFSVDSRTGPLDGPAGLAGRDGTAGPDGTAAPTAPTWLGCDRLTGAVVPGACHGRDGGDGGPGGDGGRGRNGGTSKIAEITIAEITGSLTLVATASRGGDGGDGGPGGNGGNGGNGADGQRTLQGILLPGRGDAGGSGGAGGRGGRGGDGGISSNVFVSLPPGQDGRLRVRSHPSPGGRGGRGGAGGIGGAGGRHGIPAPIPGTPAPEGPRWRHRGPSASGPDGTDGHDGRARPAPPVFVNERPAEPMPGPAAIRPPAAVTSRDIRRGGASTSEPRSRANELTPPATGGKVMTSTSNLEAHGIPVTAAASRWDHDGSARRRAAPLAARPGLRRAGTRDALPGAVRRNQPAPGEALARASRSESRRTRSGTRSCRRRTRPRATVFPMTVHVIASRRAQ